MDRYTYYAIRSLARNSKKSNLTGSEQVLLLLIILIGLLPGIYFCNPIGKPANQYINEVTIYMIIYILYSVVAGVIVRKRHEKKVRELEKKKKKKIKRYNNLQSLLDRIDEMTGVEFEDFVKANILPKIGYTDLSTTKTSGDYGVDIICYKDDVKCAVQCKRFGGKVGVGAIQEIVAGKKHYKCDTTMVITNSYFTNQAINLANDNVVRLIDREEMIHIIKQKKEE